MSDELLQALECHFTEAAVESALAALTDHVAMHGTQVFEQMGFLLEHSHTQSTCKRFLTRVHS